MAATVANLTLAAASVEMMKAAMQPCLSPVYYLAQYLKAFGEICREILFAQITTRRLTHRQLSQQWVSG
jgi:hypothetical protein